MGLAEDDASLMWKVFDYASLSASPNKRPRFQVDTSVTSERNGQPEYATAAPATVQRSTFETPVNTTANIPIDTLGFQNFSIPEENLESMDLSMFDQLPEDWAFTIDDWTLFGAPGSTYFYNSEAS